MTEHILNFAIGIDDDGIKDAVKKGAVAQITKEIEDAVVAHVFEKAYFSQKLFETDYSGNRKISRDLLLSDFAKKIVSDVITENKELIIDKAVSELAKNMMRSKVVKEKLAHIDEVNK